MDNITKAIYIIGFIIIVTTWGIHQIGEFERADEQLEIAEELSIELKSLSDQMEYFDNEINEQYKLLRRKD